MCYVLKLGIEKPDTISAFKELPSYDETCWEQYTETTALWWNVPNIRRVETGHGDFQGNQTT